MLPEKELRARYEKAEKILSSCVLCPRRCRVNRLKGEKGFCGAGADAAIASCGAHYGEEGPLSGWMGSGTIFFSGCSLECVFCQNYPVSRFREGGEISAGELSGIMLRLQDSGCHNINLVTPSHFAPRIIEALLIAGPEKLIIPVVYNCGGYEDVETLRLLDGIIDIYMPDAKYSNPDISGELSYAPDYFERLKEALAEMHRQVGDLVINTSGIAERGLLVRHLVLPGGLAGTEKIMEFISQQISKDTYVNIMDQYRPAFRAAEHHPLNRTISRGEYEEALRSARRNGLYRLD